MNTNQKNLMNIGICTSNIIDDNEHNEDQKDNPLKKQLKQTLAGLLE